MLSISLVHEALLLIYEILFELLFSDLLQFHLTLNLSFDALLLSFFAFSTCLLFVVVSFKKCLIFLLLPVNAVDGFFILSLLFGVLFCWRVS